MRIEQIHYNGSKGDTVYLINETWHTRGELELVEGHYATFTAIEKFKEEAFDDV